MRLYFSNENQHLNTKVKRNRIWEIDFLRGFCILLMVFDHAMFDFMYLSVWVYRFASHKESFLYSLSIIATKYWGWDVREAFRLAVVFLFLLLSGISCSLSRNNVKRLIKLSIASIILTIATVGADFVADMGVSIYFGILHILAFSLFIHILIEKITKNKWVSLGIGIVLVIIGLCIDYYFVMVESFYSFDALIKSIVGLVYLGADSYGIVPYTGIFLIGAFYGKLLYADKTSITPMLDRMWHKPISFVGRHTIWIYILHQPLVLGFVLLIARLSGMQLVFFM